MKVVIAAGVYLALVLVSIGSIAFGRWYGAVLRERKSAEASATLGSNVGGLLALLAFMLAVTFSLTSDRFALRKSLVYEEANALSTAYLRTDFLAPRDGDRVRQLLYELVETRTDRKLLEDPDRTDQERIQSRSEVIRGELWKAAAVAERRASDPELYAIFINSLNTLLDTTLERETVVLVHRVPPVVWGVLASISILAMLALGYQAGARDRARPVSAVALTMAFAGVLMLSVDMDSQGFGFATINQRPMLDLREEIASDLQLRAEEGPGAGALVGRRPSAP